MKASEWWSWVRYNSKVFFGKKQEDFVDFFINKLPIFREQAKASGEMVKLIKIGHKLFVLKAKTQSGKTGTIVNLINDVNSDFDLIFIALHLGENNPVEQWKSDIVNAGLGHLLGTKLFVCGLHNLTTMLNGKNRTIQQQEMSQQLKKIEEARANGKRILFIHDEIHEALGKHRVIHKYMDKCGIVVDNNTIEVTGNNVFVGIGATNFAWELSPKNGEINFIEFNTTKYYKDITDLVNSFRFINYSDFMSDLNELRDKSKKGYIVIRTGEGGKFSGVAENLEKTFKKDYYSSFHSDLSKHPVAQEIFNFYEKLESEPKSLETLLIASTMGASSRTTEKHIVGVYLFLSKELKNDAEIVQLLGRFTGYGKLKYNFPITIIGPTNDKMLEWVDRYKQGDLYSSAWTTKTKEKHGSVFDRYHESKDDAIDYLKQRGDFDKSGKSQRRTLKAKGTLGALLGSVSQTAYWRDWADLTNPPLNNVKYQEFIKKNPNPQNFAYATFKKQNIEEEMVVRKDSWLGNDMEYLIPVKNDKEAEILLNNFDLKLGKNTSQAVVNSVYKDLINVAYDRGNTLDTRRLFANVNDKTNELFNIDHFKNQNCENFLPLTEKEYFAIKDLLSQQQDEFVNFEHKRYIDICNNDKIKKGTWLKAV